MFTSAARYDQQQIERAIANIAKKFPEKVERIRYSIGEDWASDSAIFFRILLKDEAIPMRSGRESRKRAVGDISTLIVESLKNQIQTDDVQPYFSFRTASEQLELQDPEWD